MKRQMLKVEVVVAGKNVRYLPEFLRRKGVFIYNASYKGENFAIFTVDFNDLRKFFAICKNMCYNTKVKGFKGAFSIFAYAIKNIAFTIGVACFILTATIIDGLVLKIECINSCALIKNEIISTVNSRGVKIGSNFKKVNFNYLKSEILSRHFRTNRRFFSKKSKPQVYTEAIDKVGMVC